MPEDTTDFRPKDLDGFVGQAKLKERLTVQIEAAKAEERPLGHVFLTGPAGMGKTTLAHLIADLLGDPITVIQMPINEKALVWKLREFEGGVLFMDEIHALPKRQQEMLLPLLANTPAMFWDSKGRQYNVPFLCVIGATTERDRVISPLSARFPIVPEFEPYSDADMCLLVQNMAKQNSVSLPKKTADALGRATGGIPRAAEALVEAARDLTVTSRAVTAETILALCGRDPDGLTDLHRRYLENLRAQGNVASERTLLMLLEVSTSVLRDVERLLLTRGFVEYTPGGRELTPAGEKKIKGGEKRPYRRSA